MCLSILGVICYHLCLRGIHIGRLNVGYAGTDVFMLLSGYGIAKSLAHNSIVNCHDKLCMYNKFNIRSGKSWFRYIPAQYHITFILLQP